MAEEADVGVTELAGLLHGGPGDERLGVKFLSRSIYDKLSTEGAEVPPAQAKEWATAHQDDPRSEEVRAELARKGRAFNAWVTIPPAGRKMFKDEEFVRIALPGKIQQITEHRAKPHYKARFAKQYAAYKANAAQESAGGTPIEVLVNIVPPVLKPSQVDELKYCNVHTVEALVNMPETSAQHFMGIHAIQARAKAYLDASTSEAPMAHLRVENERMSGQLASQAKLIDDMTARLEKMEKKRSAEEKK